MILDLVFGAVLNHLLAYPPDRRHELSASVSRWREQAVDLVLCFVHRQVASRSR
jgi:hypothetical protein